MRVLFVLSREVMFFHGSGEVEAKLLQIGVQLLGHECHIAGLDSGDFFDYDAFFLFSLRGDVIELIAKIPHNKPCVVIPQIDLMDATAAEVLNRGAQHHRKFGLLARTSDELHRFNNFFPGRDCLLAAGWFLKPFIYEDRLRHEYENDRVEHCLCMVSADRDDGVEAMSVACRQVGRRLHIVSDRPDEHRKRYSHISQVVVKKRVPYGSLDWYARLENCSSLYEPNSNLTCSVLEALWMGKTVFSQHADYINAILGVDLIFDISRRIVEPRLTISHSDVRKLIYRYHANFVAKKMLNALG